MTIYIIQSRINDEIGGTTEWTSLWASQDKELAEKDLEKVRKWNIETGGTLNWEYRIEETTLYQ